MITPNGSMITRRGLARLNLNQINVFGTRMINTMKLTNENYYSAEANWRYMSVSQYKDFMKCEAAAMAKLRGEYVEPKSTALLVGSYVDSYFEGTLDRFKAENPEIFKRDGTLKNDYIQAETIIRKIESSPVFMKYMSGKKQVIRTAKLFETLWKIKIDSLLPDKIVDLKVMRSTERIMGRSFIEYWGYDLQMAVYSEIERKARRAKKEKETYLAVATKQEPPDIEIYHVSRFNREECLDAVKKHMPHILAVKGGNIEPERCGLCPYCRKTKILTEPIDSDLAGFSNYEIKAMKGMI